MKKLSADQRDFLVMFPTQRYRGERMPLGWPPGLSSTETGFGAQTLRSLIASELVQEYKPGYLRLTETGVAAARQNDDWLAADDSPADEHYGSNKEELEPR